MSSSKQLKMIGMYQKLSRYMLNADMHSLFVWRMHTDTLADLLCEFPELEGCSVNYQGEQAQFLGLTIVHARDFREDEILLVMKVE